MGSYSFSEKKPKKQKCSSSSQEWFSWSFNQRVVFLGASPQTPWVGFAEVWAKDDLLRSRTNAFASILEKKSFTQRVVLVFENKLRIRGIVEMIQITHPFRVGAVRTPIATMNVLVNCISIVDLQFHGTSNSLRDEIADSKDRNMIS
jgi:hypothetical protein